MKPEQRFEGERSSIGLGAPGARPAAVERGEVGEARPRGPRPQTAVFIAHGMGQQLRFETLDAVVEAVRSAAARAGRALDFTVEMADLGGTVVPRARVAVRGPDPGVPGREFHFYEAYWAPVPEGRVGLSDVLTFLCASALGGIRLALARGGFRRWMFEGVQPFRIQMAWTVARFLLAVAVTLSLFVLNTIAWAILLANHLAGDALGDTAALNLTHLKLDVILFGLACFQAVSGIALGLLERRARSVTGGGHPVGAIGRWLVYSSVAITVWAGGWTACDLWRLAAHLGPGPSFGPADSNLLAQHFSLPGASVWITIAVALGLSATFRRPRLAFVAGAATLLVNEALALGTLASLLWWGAADPAAQLPAALLAARRWAMAELWALAIVAVPVGRWFLIEYVGDVAAYLSAHAVSKFEGIRTRIQAIAADLARPIYQAQGPEGFAYDEVVWVGHSLGSVIAYDALNAMINEDGVLAKRLDVAGRTRLLLTVSSPLDKTAFIFRSQKPGETGVREGLAAARQPLIQDYGYRPREWINLYARADWIGGPLEYYDALPPEHDARVLAQLDQKAIRNQEDRAATTPLVAHTEVFSGDLFGDTLLERLLDEKARGRP